MKARRKFIQPTALFFHGLPLGLRLEVGFRLQSSHAGVRRRSGGRSHGRRLDADRHHLQLDGANAEPVAGRERGVGERLVVQPGVGRPASDDRRRRTADDQAVQGRYAAGPEPQRAARAGPDRTLGRLQPHDLPVARGAADTENQIPGGNVRFEERAGDR